MTAETAYDMIQYDIVDIGTASNCTYRIGLQIEEGTGGNQ